MKFIVVGIFTLLILASSVLAADRAEIKLLAVSDFEDRREGTTADLSLRIEPGDGKVFIESHPLTKLDTQISTRFAHRVMCDQLDLDCNNYNFFFTIRARSVIIGGPSASAAVCVC